MRAEKYCVYQAALRREGKILSARAFTPREKYRESFIKTKSRDVLLV